MPDSHLAVREAVVSAGIEVARRMLRRKQRGVRRILWPLKGAVGRDGGGDVVV
jgi:hypothetical protein